MKRIITTLLLFLSAFCINANCALILCYSGNPACSNESTWTAQLSNRLITPVETFTNNLQPSTSIIQTGGPSGFINSSTWRDATVNNPGATLPNTPIKTTTLSYLSPESTPILLWGFGANFDTSPGQGGHASGITVIINGSTITTLYNYTGGFFGVYATDPDSRFYSVVLGTSPACYDGTPTCAGWEIFDMDNLRFAVDAAPTTTETPEPGTLGLGLLGLSIARLIQLKRGRV